MNEPPTSGIVTGPDCCTARLDCPCQQYLLDGPVERLIAKTGHSISFRREVVIACYGPPRRAHVRLRKLPDGSPMPEQRGQHRTKVINELARLLQAHGDLLTVRTKPGPRSGLPCPQLVLTVERLRSEGSTVKDSCEKVAHASAYGLHVVQRRSWSRRTPLRVQIHQGLRGRALSPLLPDGGPDPIRVPSAAFVDAIEGFGRSERPSNPRCPWIGGHKPWHGPSLGASSLQHGTEDKHAMQCAVSPGHRPRLSLNHLLRCGPV
jgi:hypothetical protein